MVKICMRNLELNFCDQICLARFTLFEAVFVKMNVGLWLCLVCWIDCHAWLMFLGVFDFHDGCWLMMMNTVAFTNPNIFPEKSCFTYACVLAAVVVCDCMNHFHCHAVCIMLFESMMSMKMKCFWCIETLAIVQNIFTRLVLCTVPLRTGQLQHFPCPFKTVRLD